MAVELYCQMGEETRVEEIERGREREGEGRRKRGMKGGRKREREGEREREREREKGREKNYFRKHYNHVISNLHFCSVNHVLSHDR